MYSYFDRVLHHKDIELEPNEIIHAGQDFNYNGSVTTCFVIRSGIPYMFKEIISKDTYGVVENLKQFSGRVYLYPDASGNAHKTNATKTDIEILRMGGISVHANKINPRVQDRINSVNALLSHGKLFIDTNKCPKTTEALEQQAYDDKGEAEKYSGSATIDDFTDSLGYFVSFKFPLIKNTVQSSEFIL